MNFKRFNGSTWETVQHKIYGSGTDSLTAFPAVIQASGEQLTDYLISGNTLQNGTPTPQAPVDVVGCGEWDATEQSYKLPITCANVTSNIYLGNVQTTRRIKKLVLDGTETFYKNSSDVNNYLYYFYLPEGSETASERRVFCTHLPSTGSIPITTIGCCAQGAGTFKLIYVNLGAEIMTGNNSVSRVKTYLAAQYANGTPVTVWYVLAEPETGIVNEPLMKIGDYSDTITMEQAGVAIPTSDGDNTITFGTSVQPSAMSATFKGWHPVQGAKQYDGSEWR